MGLWGAHPRPPHYGASLTNSFSQSYQLSLFLTVLLPTAFMQVDGNGVKGRPRKSWREVLKEDMRKKGLCREDAWDRSRWRRMLWEGHWRG